MVIESTVLSNSDESRLVVGSGVNRRKTIGTSRETLGNIGSQNTTLSSSVKTLEVDKLGGVGRSGLRERLDGVDSNVRVADDITRAIHLLRSSEIVGVRVHEVTRLEVLDLHRNGERSVGLNDLAVHWVRELGGWHLRLSGDNTHGCGVARARGDLLAVGDRELGGQAEVDEVVGRGQRGDLTSLCLSLSVLSEALCNNSRVEGW